MRWQVSSAMPAPTVPYVLFPEHVRCVLVGDGRVEFLDSAAFERAMREDARRRAELGWLAVRGQGGALPTSEPTTQPTR